MIHYDKCARHYVEDIDHELSIVGWKIKDLMTAMMVAFVGCQLFGALIGLSATVIQLIISREIFSRELAGTPIDFDPDFVAFLRKFPKPIKKIFATNMLRVNMPYESYRR